MFKLFNYYKKAPGLLSLYVLSYFLLSISNSVLFLLTFFLIQKFTELTSSGQDYTLMWVYLGLFLIASLVKTFLLGFHNWASKIFGARISHLIRVAAFQKTLDSTFQSAQKLDRSVFTNIFGDDLETYIKNDIQFKICWIPLIDMAVTMIVLGTLVNVYALIIIGSLTIIEFALKAIYSTISKKVVYDMTVIDDNLASKFSKIIKNFSIFIFSDKLALFLSKNNKLFETAAQKRFNIELKDQAWSLITFIFATFKFLIFIGIATYLYQNNLITIAAIIVTSTNLHVASNTTSMFVDDLLSQKLVKEMSKKMEGYFVGLQPSKELEFDNFNNISLTNLSIKFEKKQLFHNFNLDVNKGDKIFISGKSGSGKSTLISCLLNQFDFNDGTLKINNKKIDKNTNISNLFSYSNNQNVIFDGNLTENITFFEEKPDVKKIESITEKLKIDYIKDKDANIKELNLSEGQKQLIMIARSFYTDKDIYVFDESLSNLDTSKSKNILHVISELNKTVILVGYGISLKDTTIFNKTIAL